MRACMARVCVEVRGQSTGVGSSIKWGLGIELLSPGFPAKVFSHWAISQPLSELLQEMIWLWARVLKSRFHLDGSILFSVSLVQEGCLLFQLPALRICSGESL